MKQLNLLLWAITLVLPLSVKAQFSTSSHLYCYEFIESVNNGVKSQSHCAGDADYYFIVFYDDYMGYQSATKNAIISHLMKNDVYDYYYKWALKMAKRLECAPVISFGTVPTTDVVKYTPKYSTGKKNTYRSMEVKCIVDKKGGWFNQPISGHWDKVNFNEKYQCFTFTIDKKELIHWNPNNPNKRDYYRLINVNSLQPNLDFLD